jgi:DNA-binding NarL/FixJ family response regulator
MIADRARAIGGSSQGAFARVQTNRKRWVDVHGAALRSGDSEERRVTVTIHPTPQSDVSRFLLEAYGLTERERDVTSCLARGFSTKDIAEALQVSSYTVKDHVKAIFVKVGARSRGELMARVFHGSAAQNV